MAEVKITSGKNQKSLKKTIGGLFALAYIVGVVVYSVWFLISGGFHRPVKELLFFFKETHIVPQAFSWELDMIVGFILLKLWVGTGLIFLLVSVFGKKSKMDFAKWKRLLDLKPLRLFYILLGGVAGEEIIFRWFPLAVLYPLWDTNLALWIIVSLSSLAFGLLHVSNEEPGQRNQIFTLPQILGSFVVSYIFLFYGFEAALAIHMIYDILFFVLLKVLWECNPEIFAEK